MKKEVPVDTDFQQVENKRLDDSPFFDDWDKVSTVDIEAGWKGVDQAGRIRSVYLHSTDKKYVAELIASSPHLISLDLEFSFVSDETLVALNECKQLEELRLGMPEKLGDQGEFSNKTMQLVSGMPLLRVLHARSDKVDDKGIQYLANLKYLEDVDLSGCKITDEAIPIFLSLPHLHRLTLIGTEVSKKGVAKLRGAPQNIKVYK
jgi:hypothetical protein